MRLVIIESPFTGEVGKNVEYAKLAMLDSLNRGEAPIASHLLYTQMLDDNIPEHRTLGIGAGLAWRKVCELPVFYVDRGWSGGMLAAKEVYENEGIEYEIRSIY